MGARQAQAAAEVLIARNASALLSWGSAGALHPKLSSGNLIIPKIVVYPQKGTFSTDDGWHNRLLSRLADQLEISTEPLAQSLTVLRSREEKLAFFKQNEALTVDMESGSVAEAATKANLPFMSIRASRIYRYPLSGVLTKVAGSGRFISWEAWREGLQTSSF